MSIAKPDQQELDVQHEGARFSHIHFTPGAHFTPEELQYIGYDIRAISSDAQACLHLLYPSLDGRETFFAHAGLTSSGLPDVAFSALDHGTHTMMLTTVGVNQAIHEKIRQLLLDSRCNTEVVQRKAA